MSVRRRHLPSMSALTAFDAAARTGSFTAAGQELGLTQGAVSRQIKGLEDLLGCPLFVREGQRVSLTPAGQDYAESVADALRRIGAASLRVIAAPKGGVLALAVLPTFGTRWLVPRLPDFQARNPEVILHVITRLEPFDFRGEEIDAAIHFGDPDWPGAVCDRLMGEDVLPVASPTFRAAHPAAGAEALAALPLLHTTSRSYAWMEWFAAHGIARPAGTGMHFEQFAITAQAAIAGLGVALLPTLLIQGELQAGTLVPMADQPHRSARSYYLVHPPARGQYPPLAAFRRWIVEQAKIL